MPDGCPGPAWSGPQKSKSRLARGGFRIAGARFVSRGDARSCEPLRSDVSRVALADRQRYGPVIWTPCRGCPPSGYGLAARLSDEDRLSRQLRQRGGCVVKREPLAEH